VKGDLFDFLRLSPWVGTGKFFGSVLGDVTAKPVKTGGEKKLFRQRSKQNLTANGHFENNY